MTLPTFSRLMSRTLGNSTALRHTIDTELAVTQRTDRGASILVIHRVTCRLKAPRTPLAMISATQRWSEAVPCTTCQPSARQLSELHAYIADRLELERGANVVELEPCVDDGDEIGAFLQSPAAKRVREFAADADVVPLTKRGKRNVRRNARHDQRTPAADVEQQRLAQNAQQPTKRCSDCEQDVKITSFPTSTKGGQVVRLDYCRKCRTARNAAKGGK